MRLIVSDSAADFIKAHGGNLYIWMKKARCCGGGFLSLGTATEARARLDFRAIDGGGSFKIFVPATLDRLPDELHVELCKWPRRVQAYWNGCAFVV